MLRYHDATKQKQSSPKAAEKEFIMSQQEIKLEKVKKSCGVAKKITKVIYKLCRVAAILLTVAAILVGCNGDKVTEVIENSGGSMTFNQSVIEVGGLMKFGINVQEYADSGRYVDAMIIVLIASIVLCVFTSVIFKLLHRVFVSIEESESPFSSEGMHTMKRSFIMICVLTMLCIDVGTALTLALFLWCIYCILDYGAALQNEVDETL